MCRCKNSNLTVSRLALALAHILIDPLIPISSRVFARHVANVFGIFCILQFILLAVRLMKQQQIR